jgi:hypothetical protein
MMRSIIYYYITADIIITTRGERSERRSEAATR